MKTFAKFLLFDEKGLTLIEVLAALVISAITLSTIYGVFITGLKLYEQIAVEGQLRDDADYVVTMIMNELYSIPFDYIEYCPNAPQGTCIRVEDSKYVGIEKYNDMIDVNKEATKNSSEMKEIKIVETEDGAYKIQIDETIIDTKADFKNSSITFDCSQTEDNGKCKQALINIHLRASHERTKKVLNLESHFGF
ncbi:prepilin-type N-terminal cleavage/methylation domain-containing protein [Anoxybacillus vitaminiphilus]|uniref:Prepilin-type N-terminal cleavage/methylation domain-containing protein n=1 Tax=Paranoxybacillus vitaminiphilus TaxID=581036 RepID=A0A327YKA5_9BACL|nr:prepilin-type N-terminal cleavage/methylation domain-containing protein [Anoxybacillus vitaminiphilus]RAK21373.1 prepilin-type N-terminal cleavage/methylation domain-containing protein [Anoxybacillus vitaminiphilus]